MRRACACVRADRQKRVEEPELEGENEKMTCALSQQHSF